MANLTINEGGIITNKTNLPNIDLRYGPYNSLEEAYSALEDVITPGLIIGVRENGAIVNYKINNNNKAVRYLPCISLINNNTLVIDGRAFTLTPSQTNDIIFGNITTNVTPGSTLKLGDVINIRLSIFNNTTTDFGGSGETLTITNGDSTIKTINKAIKPGELITADVDLTVTEADILAGEVHQNYNLVQGNTTIKQTLVEINTETPNGHLTINKITTSDTPDDGYALYDNILYRITVTNDGNLTITDITVTDDITGDEWIIPNSLASNESWSTEAEYTVTETDILARAVVNIATATGTSPDPEEPNVPCDSGEDVEPTEDPEGHLTILATITSTPSNGVAYDVGETIEGQLIVTNDGNLTINDIRVSCKLTGDEWPPISGLSPDAQSNPLTWSYQVTEEDILNREVNFVFTTTCSPLYPEAPDPTVNVVVSPVPTVEPSAQLTITKMTTSGPNNGSAYGLGEEITYRVTVTNSGNVTITNITVTDDLTGNEWPIASLGPGGYEEFNTTPYLVTTADIERGEVLNVATATGTSPDPENIEVEVIDREDTEPTVEPSM